MPSTAWGRTGRNQAMPTAPVTLAVGAEAGAAPVGLTVAVATRATVVDAVGAAAAAVTELAWGLRDIIPHNS